MQSNITHLFLNKITWYYFRTYCWLQFSWFK